MGILSKLEAEVELKSSAHKYFKLLSTEMHRVPTASPDKVHTAEVHEGDWETPGSLKLWTFTVDGRKETMKEKVEVDEANKSVTYVAVEGHVLERYKSFKINMKVIPKGEAAVLKITLTYEKQDESVVDAHDYIQLVTGILKDIDEHLMTQS